MNRIALKKNSIMDYDVYLFDLDGTLYYQKPFRIKMLCTLMKHVLVHPLSIADMFLIKTYRTVREHWEQCEAECSFDSQISLDEKQYAYVAKKKGTTPEQVKRAVELFMLEMPLRVLPLFRDEVIYALIQKLREEKKTIVIYSDYPVENKLACLGITANACYTSSDACINCMKPDPKGIRVILSTLGCDCADAVMIGDRYEKDGLAAERNNVDYLIVDSAKRERQKLLKMWS
ncbi:MAG: HAD family hydrolase [Lachnospiraceae bacterium]|nr:HAD family hydrolase [Lachnospiraceae bacterium]